MGRSLLLGPGTDLPELGLSTAFTAYTSVTPGYSNAAGAWTEIVASTSGETHWLDLVLTSFGTSAAQMGVFLDVAVGPAAAEVPIVSSLAVSGSTTRTYRLPLRIPSGSRISVRASSTSATNPTGCQVAVHAYDRIRGDKRSSPTYLVAVGTGATNIGTLATVNDTYVELDASLTQAFRGFFLSVHNYDSSQGANLSLFTVAIGASGNEQPIACSTSDPTTTELVRGFAMPTKFEIPAGSRLSYKSNLATNNTVGAVAQMIPYS